MYFFFQQMELKIKLYGLTEDLDNSRSRKKKRPKKHLSEINAMVETLIKENMPESSKQKGNKPTLPCKRKGTALSQKQDISPDAKTGLRQHLNTKMSTGRHTQNDNPSNKGVADQGHLRTRNQIPPALDNGCDHLGKIDHCKANPQQYVLEADSNVQLGLKEEERIFEVTPEQCNILLELFESHENDTLQNSNPSPQPDVFAKQECMSPVTSTSNMLERLLRKSEKSSSGCSDCSGLEDSTESMMGSL
jgi:hypothetical protein